MANSILDATITAFDEENVIYVPKQGTRFKVKAVFDNEFENFDAQTENVIASNQPAVGVQLSDFPACPKKGEVFIVKNKPHKIIDVQEDGQGGATIFLHKQ